MPYFSSNLGQRHQNESTLGHSRMWYLQFARMDHAIVEKQNIEVDRARLLQSAVGGLHCITLSPKFPLDLQQRVQQLLRHQIRFRLHGAVEKPTLSPNVYWLGLIKRGSPHHTHSARFHRLNRPGNVLLAISQIRSKREVNRI